MGRTLQRSRRRSDDTEPENTADNSTPDEGEEETPSRGRRTRRTESSDDSGPRKPGRRRAPAPDEDEESEPDEPKGRGGKDKTPRESTLGAGWGSFKAQKKEASDYGNKFTMPEKEPVLIVFLDEAPFAVFQQHWIPRKGKQSFTCLGKGKCPLCDNLGDKPSVYALFNIVDFTDPDQPVNAFWQVGQRVAGTIETYAGDKKTSPINREDLAWSVFKSGKKGGNVQTNLNPVKARDLKEDWDVDPLTEEEYGEFLEHAYAKDDVVFVSTKAELRQIVEEVEDDY